MFLTIWNTEQISEHIYNKSIEMFRNPDKFVGISNGVWKIRPLDTAYWTSWELDKSGFQIVTVLGKLIDNHWRRFQKNEHVHSMRSRAAYFLPELRKLVHCTCLRVRDLPMWRNYFSLSLTWATQIPRCPSWRSWSLQIAGFRRLKLN
jgi:hypothetical protein